MVEPTSEPESMAGRSSYRPFSPLRLGLITAIVAVGLGTLVIVLLVPTLRRTRELNRRLICGSQLKGIVTAFKIYANDNDSEFASTGAIESLIGRGDLSREQTVCPGSGLSTSNYLIVPLSWAEPADNRTVVAYEPKSNHGDGGNFLYADGHAAFAKGDEYDRLVAEARVQMRP